MAFKLPISQFERDTRRDFLKLMGFATPAVLLTIPMPLPDPPELTKRDVFEIALYEGIATMPEQYRETARSPEPGARSPEPGARRALCTPSSLPAPWALQQFGKPSKNS